VRKGNSSGREEKYSERRGSVNEKTHARPRSADRTLSQTLGRGGFAGALFGMRLGSKWLEGQRVKRRQNKKKKSRGIDVKSPCNERKRGKGTVEVWSQVGGGGGLKRKEKKKKKKNRRRLILPL